ncbi:MAG: hypothetical protein AAF307_10245 [Pseudomonadota bacterium]
MATVAQIEESMRVIALHMQQSDQGETFAPLFARLMQERDAAKDRRATVQDAAAFLRDHKAG